MQWVLGNGAKVNHTEVSVASDIVKFLTAGGPSVKSTQNLSLKQKVLVTISEVNYAWLKFT